MLKGYYGLFFSQLVLDSCLPQPYCKVCGTNCCTWEDMTSVKADVFCWRSVEVAS